MSAMSSENQKRIACKQQGHVAGNQRLIDDTSGMALIEFAFLLPIFVLLICAVVEFGWYFIRYEAVNRAVSVTAATLANGGNTLTQANAEGNASNVVSFTTSPSFICAQAFSTNAKALAASPNFCNQPMTDTTPVTNTVPATTWAPGGGATLPTCIDTGSVCPSSYFLGIAAYAGPMSLTGFAQKIIPQSTAITQYVIQPVGTAAASSGTSGGVVFVTPVVLYTDTAGAALAWTTTPNLTQYGIPANASAVILSTLIHGNNVNGWNAYITERSSSSSTATYTLASMQTAGGGAPSLVNSNQGIYPLAVSGDSVTFDYEASVNLNGSTITLVGYIGSPPSGN